MRACRDGCTMLITAAERVKALCRCSHSAALAAPQKSSLASSWDGTSFPRPCTTFFSTSRGHLSLVAVLLMPASCSNFELVQFSACCPHIRKAEMIL